MGDEEGVVLHDMQEHAKERLLFYPPLTALQDVVDIDHGICCFCLGMALGTPHEEHTVTRAGSQVLIQAH